MLVAYTRCYIKDW